MSAVIEPLVHDLVQWCVRQPRSYAEALEAWRTNCPRLMVWEEAVARGFLETCPGEAGLVVAVTAKGLAWLGPVEPVVPSRPPAARVRV